MNLDKITDLVDELEKSRPKLGANSDLSDDDSIDYSTFFETTNKKRKKSRKAIMKKSVDPIIGESINIIS
jgi:hypothetical protein